MLLTLILLQAAAAATPAPDIALDVAVQARSVTIAKQGEASLTVRTEPDGGNVVDVRAPKANGRKTLRNVAATVHAEARIADPARPAENNGPVTETPVPQ